ncbi:MAG: ComF family protein [Prevotella sp.]|nr:ComF family protein [Prevotella sp.]
MGSFWTRLFDLIAPRSCAACDRRLGESERAVCLNCLLALPRTHYAENPYDNPMAQLFWGQIPVERAAAWFFYQPASPYSPMIHHLKYHQQEEIGHFIGRVAAEEFAEHQFFDGIDGLLPIPLTKRRQRQRGYNQSRVIASGISEVTGIPILDGVVRRTHFEESQTHKTAAERRKNVKGVFEVINAEALANRHILVIDDIITTGSTIISFCQEVAEKSPSVKISIFSAGFTRS